jgi:hypothetical protein
MHSSSRSRTHRHHPRESANPPAPRVASARASDGDTVVAPRGNVHDGDPNQGTDAFGSGLAGAAYEGREKGAGEGPLWAARSAPQVWWGAVSHVGEGENEERRGGGGKGRRREGEEEGRGGGGWQSKGPGQASGAGISQKPTESRGQGRRMHRYPLCTPPPRSSASWCARCHCKDQSEQKNNRTLIWFAVEVPWCGQQRRRRGPRPTGPRHQMVPSRASPTPVNTRGKDSAHAL